MAIAISPHAAFRLCCLGPVLLTNAEGADLGLRTRKLLALLLVLARQVGKPIGREALIGLLWSKDSEQKARHSLSQAVSLINKAFGGEAIASADRDRLLLRPGVVWLDVDEFERLAARGEYAEARQLWRGTLLEGIWIRRAPGFDRWLAEERQRLERTLRRLAHGLIEDRRVEGDYQAMRAEAEALLELDSLDEKAMLACLEAMQLDGDRTLALRRYAEFERHLKQELDAEPGSALRGWARRNRRGDSGAALRYVPIPHVSETMALPAPQPLFGRVEEYALLWNAWEQTQTGRGAFVLLEGEAGIGKTALATKLANQVHVAGGSVCFVRCYRTEKSVPFAPVTSLIRQLSRLPGFVALDPVWIGELTRLVPELRDRYPNAPLPMAVDDAARHRLSDATMQAALAVADEQPLLIVVDDLQHADEATLAALHYLGRQTATQPIVFVGGRRVLERLSDLERAFFETAGPEGGARTVQLSKLPRQELERLVLQVLARSGASVSSEVVEGIVAGAGGNPLQAIEAAVSATRRSGPPPSAVPLGDRESAFDASVAERLKQLSAPALLVAQAVAVAGRPLSGYELSSVTRLPIAEMAAAISELETQQLLRRTEGGLGLWHERYAQTVETHITEGTRRHLHYELAQLLRRSAATNPAARFEVARHYARAAKHRQARSEALQAARHARSLGAVRERANALELALSLGKSIDPDIASQLGGCLLALRDFNRLDEVCALARSAPIDAKSQSNFAYLCIAADVHRGRIPLSTAKRQLAQLLAHSQSFDFEGAARMSLLRAAYRSSDHQSARKAARDIRRRLASSDSVRYGHALLASAYITSKYYWPRRAMSPLRSALEIATKGHDLELEHLCRTGLGAVCRQVGDFERSIVELELALALARRTLNPQLVAGSLSDIAVAEMARGNYDRCDLLLQSAEGILKEHPDGLVQALGDLNSGEIALLRGELSKATRLFQEALDRSLRLELMPGALQAAAGLALVAQRSGDADGLNARCVELGQLGEGREHIIHERWMLDAAIAWNVALNEGDPPRAVAYLTTSARALRRRDVDHWLSVELELLRLQASCCGGFREEDRSRLQSHASEYGAGGVLRSLELLQEGRPAAPASYPSACLGPPHDAKVACAGVPLPSGQPPDGLTAKQ